MAHGWTIGSDTLKDSYKIGSRPRASIFHDGHCKFHHSSLQAAGSENAKDTSPNSLARCETPRVDLSKGNRLTFLLS